MRRLSSTRAIFAALTLSAAVAQATPEQALQREVGRALASQTINLVEREGLPPRVQGEYEAFKNNVLQLLDAPGDTVSREQLYLRLQLMLNTLDADGHSFLLAPAQGTASPPAAAGDISSTAALTLIQTPSGKVVRFTPAQIAAADEASMRLYASHTLEQMQSSGLAERACAVVVDLSEQTGGNALPVIDLLRPLFSASNSAHLVDRDGKRMPLFTLTYLDSLQAKLDGGISNPLARFAGQPIAFVMTGRTASAGEMIAVALLGEGERVRSFGWNSHGLTTANRTFALPDNATLVLSGARYGVADQAPIRGKIQPQVPAAVGEELAQVLVKSASWAASESSLCKAAEQP